MSGAAKGKAGKKKNYRLRRTVRKTLGALLMISAMVIAAIPFPQAGATETMTDTDTETENGLDYEKDVTDDDKEEIPSDSKVDLSSTGSQTISNAYTLYYIAGSGYYYQWQFKYYYDDVAGGAIISQYNNDFRVEEVVLEGTINSTYVLIEKSVFDSYFAAGTNGSSAGEGYSLTISESNYDNDLVKKYFPEKCAEYATNKESNNATNITVYPSNLSESNKYMYYCDFGLKDGDGEAYLSEKGFTLKPVYVEKAEEETVESGTESTDDSGETSSSDTSSSGFSGYDIYYIPRATEDAEDVTGYATDTEGFLYPSTEAPILRGIADGAFKGVKNVDTLTLPEQLKYIGDSAFESSFLKKITLTNVEEIGNQAFKECTVLTEVELGSATQIIGMEAFYHTALTSIDFPYSLETIGAGAFAECSSLVTLDFSAMEKASATIKEYAFFNCTALSSQLLEEVGIVAIGKAAFAVTKGTSGACTRFTFPSGIDSAGDLEDYVLAGRADLQEVLMPAEYGRSEETALPDNIFSGCTNLAVVEFPVDSAYSCGYVTFENTIFEDVTNANFYVKGPQKDKVGGVASPRKSTWICTMADGTSVPYVYEIDGEEYYEVSDETGTYLLLIDSAGVLSDCGFIDEDKTKEINDFTIPGVVGNLQVTGIADGCFEEEFLECLTGRVVIEDGGAIASIGGEAFAGSSMTELYIGDSVQTIGAEAFAGCDSLGQVVIGKNVSLIGAEAFSGCSSLTQVLFIQPDDYSTLPLSGIGEDAFTTGGEKLVFIGSANEGYGPFAWAMQADNYVDKDDGIRVCYKTPAAGYLDIVEDNKERELTGEEETTEPEEIVTDLTIILDNRNNYPTLVDYTHYHEIPEDYRTAYEDDEALTPVAETWIKSALNVTVPDGVYSIDAKGYFNNDSQEVDGVEPYSNASNWAAYFMNSDTSKLDDEYAEYKEYGLFNGYYGKEPDSEDDNAAREYEEGNDEEVKSVGNDRIESITLTSVKYLPDYAFHSCENLETVTASADLTDIGALPFYECGSVSGVSFGDSAQYSCVNGIIYETLEDGTKSIVECLASRGSVVGSDTVDLVNDPDLASVSVIAEGAFSECDDLTSFDLTGVTGISAIPDECFKGCDDLVVVDLPAEVRSIGNEAFADVGENIWIYVRGKEVGLGQDAFDNNEEDTHLYSYKDTAVLAAAASQGANVYTLDDTFTVKFYSGSTLVKTDIVEEGDRAIPPEDDEVPVPTGYTFKGWDQDYSNVTSDMSIFAVLEAKSSSAEDGSDDDGSDDDDDDDEDDDSDEDDDEEYDEDGNRLYTLTVTDGNGDGKYAAGTTVSIYATGGGSGKTFGYWSSSNSGVVFADSSKLTTTMVMPNSDATVIANYVGQYKLVVEAGSGSGSYAAGTEVTITASKAATGMEFSRWTTDNTALTIASSTSSTTTVTIPESDSTVTANYSNTGAAAGTASTDTAGGSTDTSSNKTSIIITKPGISDTDQASAYVSGSSDGFIVKVSESAEATAAVETALSQEYPDMSPVLWTAMDISLYDSTGQTQVTDTENLKVHITMPIADSLKSYGSNVKVAAVSDEGQLENLTPKFTTVNGVACVSYTATHFSPYTLYVDTANLTAGSVLDSTPQTGDGIHPKWFVCIGLASVSMILFLKKDSRYRAKVS